MRTYFHWIARVGIVFFLGLNSQFVLADEKYVSGIDHAPTLPGYEQAARQFTEDTFMVDGRFDVKKIEDFIEQTEKLRLAVASDIYETTLLEKLETRLKKHKKAAKKAAAKQSAANKGFVQYLQPKLNNLLECVKENRHQEECQGIVDDFIRGYNAYYMPNAHRTIFPFDTDFFFSVKRLLIPYSFKKNDSESLEANNLMVDAEHSEAINTCLRNPKKVGSYLNYFELTKLQSCGFDLSLLNPGVSALWHPLTEEERKHIHEIDQTQFPLSDTVDFDNLIYRGAGSLKFKIAFDPKEGKRKTIKLKASRENHTDMAISKLWELIGLNQDRMIYKKEIKMMLGEETSYEQLLALVANKYGMENMRRFIWGHGGEKGNEWVVLKDVILEARPSYESRVCSMDIASWDLTNRREYRALLLAWAWVGINDTKNQNFKLLFKRLENGDLFPMHRLQDTGIGLGGATNVRNPNNILSIFQYYKVNEFPTSFLNKKKDSVQILWNDFFNRERTFKSTTWNDLRWMARKIAAIKSEDIRTALLDSGMPDPVALIYWHKLRLRRNEIVKAFDLENEFPPFNVPDLDHYNPDEDSDKRAIVNGKVVQTSFEGKNDVVQVQNSWLTLIPNLFTFNIPIKDWTDTKTGSKISGSLQGLQGLKGELDVIPSTLPGAKTVMPLGVGISAILTRSVSPNTLIVNSEGESHLYKIVDTLEIQVGANSPLLSSILTKIPHFGGALSLKFFSRQYEFYHYAETVKQAYLKKFPLFEIIKDPTMYAAFDLKTLEVIRIFNSVGLEGEVGVSVYNQKPFFANEISALGGIRKAIQDYFIRDEYGQLHVYVDNTKRHYAGINVVLGEVDALLSKISVFNLSLGKSSYKHHAVDNVIRGSKLRIEKAGPLDVKRALDEYQALQKFQLFRDREFFVDDEQFEKNYEIFSSGGTVKKSIGGLFVLNNEHTANHSNTSVVLADGTQRNFYRYTVAKNKNIGRETLRVDFGQSDVLVKSRRKSTVTLEMDRDKEDDFLVIVRNEDFFRFADHKELVEIIGDLNRRYSKKSDELFYRDYVLPEADAVDTYRKVYAMTRIFINGPRLIEAIKTAKESEMHTLAKAHFNVGSKLTRHFKVRKFLRAFKKLQAKVNANSSVDFKGFGKYLDSFVAANRTEIHGVGLLQELVGKKGIYVMGDIAGIYESFTSLYELQQVQRRRFAGKSWGNYKIVPPIQKFLRYSRLIPPSVYITKGANDQELFGELETGVAQNIKDTFYQDGF